MDELLTDPDKVGLVFVLGLLVVALVRGTLSSGVVHERHMAQLRKDHEEEIAQLRVDYEERLKAERERTAEWRAMAQQGSKVAREVVELAKQTSAEK